jgi:hypothetical protein
MEKGSMSQAIGPKIRTSGNFFILKISGLIRIKKDHTLRVIGKAGDLDRDKILRLENSNLED